MMWRRMGGRSFGALALLFGLLAGHASQPAEAQVTFTQITSSTGMDLSFTSSPSISANGTRIAFDSYRNLTGGNPDGDHEIFLWTLGSGITQITSATSTWGYNSRPSISADGTRIAFLSYINLTGGNQYGNQEIFLWTQNSGITQITNQPNGYDIEYGYSINADGTRITFTSEHDLTGENPYGVPQIFLWTQGTGFTQITSSVRDWSTYPVINAAGTRIAFVSDADLTGGNPDGNDEIFFWTQGSGFTQITSSTQSTHALSYFLSISADGARIAFVSDLNLTGGNPDGNYEIFLWTQGAGITQITNTASILSHNAGPSISADGTRIAFVSDADLTGGNPYRRREIFLWTQGSGIAQITNTIGGNIYGYSINADGTRIAFSSGSNPTGGNPDYNTEIFLATFSPVVAVDTDSDGMPDSWELAHGLNPNDPSNAIQDPDDDGLTNLQEFQAGTDPHNPDTDGDGLMDGEDTTPKRVDTSVSPIPPTQAGKAVVITHGWWSDASSWVTTMANKICANLHASIVDDPKANTLTMRCQGNGWDVWVYDWQDDANVFQGRLNLDELGRWPNEVIPYAERNGDILASELLLMKNNYQHIHLIAHSAGSALIDKATYWLSHVNGVTIHETFLDAYDPRKKDSTYGKDADWADNYVDIRDLDPGVPFYDDGTKLFLQNAYNIDVTSTILAMCGPICRHSRPYRFYGWSIDEAFVSDYSDYQNIDPISSSAGMGYPLSVEAGHTVAGLQHAFPSKERRKCIVAGDVCYPDALPPSLWHFVPTATKETTVNFATTAVEYVQGAGAYVFNSVKLGWAWVAPGLAPQQTLGVRQSATAAATTTEAPSYLVVNVMTTTPVNTLRFNWSFATAGEGLLRVFVGGNLVREIDQRHVTPSSPETEEVYIGGDGVSLPAGTHRITFRFDGFGASASGVELTNVELGMLEVAVSPMTISTTALPTGEKGVPYAHALQAEGGMPPYTWSRIKGKLPKGVTLDAAGTLSGIPTKAKTATFTVQVTDATAASATQTFSLKTVRPVTLKTKRLSQGRVGTPYAATLKTKGGISPLTFSLVGGALPPDLTIDPATGQISGTPATVGTFDFQVRVASSGGSSDQRSIQIKIK